VPEVGALHDTRWGWWLGQVTGPEGWAFEPAELAVDVGVNGQCNDGQDINFRHTGFSLRCATAGLLAELT
jgi:hypothetical protein